MNEQSPFLTFLILSSAVAANLWCFFYAFRPWRVTAQGQALMVKAIGNAVVLDMAAAFTLFGDYAGREWVRTVGFSIFTVGIYYLLGSLLFSKGATKYPPWSWLPRNRERV